MPQVVSALRIMGTVLLSLIELVLVALFSMAVAADGLSMEEIACLVLHCLATMLVWATEIFAIMRQGRDPHDIAYILVNILLVIVTSAAFGLYAFHVARAAPDMLSFATLGVPTAYAVLILSWVVTMLSIQALIFSGADKCHAKPSSSKTEQHKKPKRSKNVDWTQRPLPLTIVNVVHGGGPETLQNPGTVPDNLMKQHMLGRLVDVPLKDTPLRTTYSHWPEEV